MDFFTVPTAAFRVLYVLFIIRHGRRDVAWYGVTASPTAAWVAQQLREAFPLVKSRSVCSLTAAWTSPAGQAAFACSAFS